MYNPIVSFCEKHPEYQNSKEWEYIVNIYESLREKESKRLIIDVF